MVFTSSYHYFYPVSHSETANGIHYMYFKGSFLYLHVHVGSFLHMCPCSSILLSKFSIHSYCNMYVA